MRIFWLVNFLKTLWTGDADMRLYVTTAQDGWRKSALLTRAWFPRTIHLITQYMEPFSEWPCCWWSLVSISWNFQFTKIVSEFFYKFLKKHSIKVDLRGLNHGNMHLNNLNAPVLNVLSMIWCCTLKNRFICLYDALLCWWSVLGPYIVINLFLKSLWHIHCVSLHKTDIN